MTQQPLRTLVVEVRDADRRVEKVVADGPRILIGSGAHCDVCLPPGAAANEHVEVTVSASGELVAEVLADHPNATLRGAPFRRERLGAGDVLAIGTLELHVALADVPGAGRKATRGPRRTLVFGFVAACATLALSFGARPDDPGARPAPAPPLWPADASAACPAAEPSTALAMAVDLRARADAKRERVRFAVQEGVAAVELLERATACLRAAGQPARAAEVSEVAGTLRARVSEAYRGHQLRLEHALAVDEIDTALREVRILRAMAPAPASPWATWLGALDQTLQQRQQRQPKKSGS